VEAVGTWTVEGGNALKIPERNAAASKERGFGSAPNPTFVPSVQRCTGAGWITPIAT
jgi:hypothetical protein